MKTSVKTVLIVLLAACLFGTASCSAVTVSFDEARAELAAEEAIDSYFDNPENFNWDEYCEDGYSPKQLDHDRAAVFKYATGTVEYTISDSEFNEEHDKVKLYYTFGNVRYVDGLEGSVEQIKEQLSGRPANTETVELQLVYEDGRWLIHNLKTFENIFIDAYANLNISETATTTETTGTNETSQISASDESTVISATWYDVETGNPLERDMVSDAYAVQAVFYFSTPQTGQFHAELISESGDVILSADITADNEITVVCDFSAGLQGWGTFDTGSYCAVLFKDGSEIARTKYLKVI